MVNAELVFVPFPGVGHLISTVEIAKLLVERDTRLSITVLVMKFPFDTKIASYTQKLNASSISPRIKFIELLEVVSENQGGSPAANFMGSFIESQKPQVKEAVNRLTQPPDSPRLAGFVVDMFCAAMIDVANEFGLPSYLFYTSNGSYLSLIFYLQILNDEHQKDITKFRNSDAVLLVPGLMNPVPAGVLRASILDGKESHELTLVLTRKYRKTKGIMVNTFMELESSALSALPYGNRDTPVIYPVGPILSLNGDGGEKDEGSDIIKWLDDQPSLSVVFLCFGSMGSFDEDQVKEMATALEKSGHRFLWSLRQSPPKGQFSSPTDYSNPAAILPEGFLDRTAGVGKVIGWAPQIAILAHPAIGGFVSHCGWNSTLESIWFGVPVATWPLYAEQQFNAFCLLKEYGIAEEITMDYKKNFFGESQILIGAEQIEKGIRNVMEMDVAKRKKVKGVSEKSREAMAKGGSSYLALGQFIDDVFNNLP